MVISIAIVKIATLICDIQSLLFDRLLCFSRNENESKVEKCNFSNLMEIEQRNYKAVISAIYFSTALANDYAHPIKLFAALSQ